MKCPKCGYLGFEATDRCRNCGYDFSLATPLSTPSSSSPAAELPLRASRPETAMVDLALRTDDDDDGPLMGLAEPSAAPPLAKPVPAFARSASKPTPAPAPRPALEAIVEPEPEPEPEPADDLPLFAPRPAGTPLAVRRTSDIPKSRRTTRPIRVEPAELPWVDEDPSEPEPEVLTRHPRAATPVLAGPVARVGAALIDAGILLAIDAVVVALTLRLAGLPFTVTDAARLRPVPLVAFFLVMAFLYLVGFTLAGGQTIGKMTTGIRVTGDDGRGVDLTGAVVRAVVGIASFLTLGLLFAPVFVSAERRSVHDRLAGTRVVAG
jgi:uncharacterized RDD family membrane protein YckC